ncbi:MAG TPA: bacillithiol system redox-active protein YtxJ [Planctomycetota bacterium]|nr:bacillithiol system redox-active protein YtxJ [Planctomycetota bacterium]
MKDLASLEDLDVVLAPAPGPVLLYKHSTQCGICDAAIVEVEEFERRSAGAVAVHCLDLLAHRDVSNAVAQRLGIRHESPQAILLRDGKPVAVLNHRSIKADALSKAAAISATQKR